MSNQKLVELLKVHIKAAESCGKMEAAFAVLEILVVVESESSEENHLHNDS